MPAAFQVQSGTAVRGKVLYRDNKQIIEQASADGNVMERVLNAFDGLYDNATTFISGAAASAGEIGSDLGGNAGDLAGSLGEKAGDLGTKAGGVAAGIGATVGEKLDTAVTFARGLFGG